MYFQAIDDKSNCVGVYFDGHLVFDEDEMPKSFANGKTWKYSGSITDESVKYGWLVSEGKNLSEVCPDHLKDKLTKQQKKMHAFKRSFEIAKIDFRQHCFFDLVPHDFLKEFLDVKNQITQHVFENNEIPPTYEHLAAVEKLLYKIRYRELEVNVKDCRGIMANYNFRTAANKILNNSKYIDYNLFGTATGRLSTYPGSFPILTMKKELRMLVKPRNDWFLSLDYNGAEARTVLGLLGAEQPDYDVHEWNLNNVITNNVNNREDAKKTFFSWLYNPDSNVIQDSIYDRDALLERFYVDGHIETIFGRKIKVDKYKALNYIIESTTADLVNDRAVQMDKFLDGKKSFVSHIVHDEVVIDLHDEDRALVPDIESLFSNNKIGKYKTNLKAAKNYYDLEVLNI